MLERGGSGRALTVIERERYSAWFAPPVLDAARIVDGRVPRWLRPDMCGVTLGTRVHFRPGAYDAATLDGIELLGHELVHVQQFMQGMTVWRYVWSSRRGYRRNPYECEAYAFAAGIRADLCRPDVRPG